MASITDIGSNTFQVSEFITNEYLASLSDLCRSTCEPGNDSTTVLYGDTKSVKVTTRCTAPAACVMANIANGVAANIAYDIAQQNTTSVTDIMGDLSYQDIENNENIAKTLSNYITQMATQTCGSIDPDCTHQFVYVKTGGSSGSYHLTANEGSVNATCAVANMLKMQTYNQVQANIDDSNFSIGVFVVLIAILLVIVIMITIIYVIFYSTGPLGRAFSGDGYVIDYAT